VTRDHRILTINVNDTIEKTVALFRNNLKKNRVKTNLELSSKVPMINASPQQLSQVWLNLLNNAIEVLTGKLKKGKQSSATDREINIKSNLRKGNVVIRFSDSGPGISEDDLNKVFDPFYTRKKTMGLGVGLSICHDIIKDHGGTITASNSPEGGAVFTIKLPVDQT
jgi:C4-dicarboxylate-specific signal transduction histidine kinase